MIKKELVRKIIKKVVKNGYDVELGVREDVVKIFKGKKVGKLDFASKIISINEFILSIEFAKAFWGESCYRCPLRDHSDHSIKRWQYYLSEMVIKKYRFKYLERFVK